MKYFLRHEKDWIIEFDDEVKKFSMFIHGDIEDFEATEFNPIQSDEIPQKPLKHFGKKSNGICINGHEVETLRAKENAECLFCQSKDIDWKQINQKTNL